MIFFCGEDTMEDESARVLLNPERCGVLVTDVQTSFLQLLPDETSWIRRLSSFVQIPKRLGIPVLVTEQTPEKLGSTVDPIRQALPQNIMVPKESYDALACNEVTAWIDDHELDQLILTGIMTNVCILQTALKALERGYTVHIPSDGTMASSEEDHWWGLRRMERAGAMVTTLETIAHEWIRSPEHPDFSDLLPILKELTN